METSCLMIEKTPIVSQDRKLTNARRSDHRCTLTTRASAARAASSMGQNPALSRCLYTSSTSTTPGTARIADAIWGEMR
jgi:hypothetical protein